MILSAERCAFKSKLISAHVSECKLTMLHPEWSFSLIFVASDLFFTVESRNKLFVRRQNVFDQYFGFS